MCTTLLTPAVCLLLRLNPGGLCEIGPNWESWARDAFTLSKHVRELCSPLIKASNQMPTNDPSPALLTIPSLHIEVVVVVAQLFKNRA